MGQEYPHAGLVGGCVDAYLRPDILTRCRSILQTVGQGACRKKPLYR